MQVFLFDGQSGRYIGSLAAQRAPRSLSGQPVWHLPPNATFVPPPAVEANQTAVYQNGSWKVVSELESETEQPLEVKFIKASARSSKKES